MSAEAWPRYFHPDGHEITAEEFDAAYDEAQAPRGNSIMTAYDRKYAEELAAAEKRAADMAAIFARLDALEVAQRQDAECMEAQALRIDCMEGDAAVMRERLESARIAAPVAPESAETASGVPQEPGNATEAQNAANRQRFMTQVLDRNDAETVAALRMYRKVQAASANDDGTVSIPHAHGVSARFLLAWLKEGEA